MFKKTPTKNNTPDGYFAGLLRDMRAPRQTLGKTSGQPSGHTHTPQPPPKTPPIRQRTPDKDYPSDPDTPILTLGDCVISLGDLTQGVLVTGGTGGGKTSGPGAMLAKSMLSQGFGGIVLCTKIDEKDLWLSYAKQCGRENSVILFDDSGKERFNFLEYELNASADRKTQTSNLVALFMRLAESQQEGHTNADPFWMAQARQLMTNVLDILILANGTVRIRDIQRFLATLPRKGGHYQSGFAISMLEKADQAVKTDPALITQGDWQVLYDFFTGELFSMDNKLYGSILATLKSVSFPFERGLPYQLFCTDTTIVPDISRQGAILIIDFSIRAYQEFGILASTIWKYMFQRATERHNIQKNARPVFIFCDEAQSFLSSYDHEFQSTARSSRACSIYMTQNIAGIYAKIGDEHKANALLGNLRTKIFCSNDCPKTGQYAADLIGKTLQYRRNHSENSGVSEGTGSSWGWSKGGNVSHTASDQGGGSSASSSSSGINEGGSANRSTNHGSSQGVSEVIDYELQPGFFAQNLRTGGKAHHYLVDAVIFQPSRAQPFAGNKNWMLCSFPQK